jgi:hypothetical protein
LPHGLLPRWRTEHLSARSGAGPARAILLYELQRRLVKAAVQNPFQESVQTIAELTGVSVSKRSLEEILPDAAQDFDVFYRQRSLAAACVFHAEGSLAADLWVLDRTPRILLGEVGQVVKGIRQSITKRALSGAKRKTLNGVADYLHRNRRHMRYDEYSPTGGQ